MATTTGTGAKKIQNTDDWRDIFDIHNDTVDAYDGKIGTTALPTTAQTITGAIDEHETDISTLNSNITNIAMSDGTDLNNITATGRTKWYIGGDISKMTNIPPSCVGNVWPFNLEVIPLNTGALYSRQILHCFGISGSMNMFVRTQTYSGGNVVWTSWMKMSYTVDS